MKGRLEGGGNKSSAIARKTDLLGQVGFLVVFRLRRSDIRLRRVVLLRSGMRLRREGCGCAASWRRRERRWLERGGSCGRMGVRIFMAEPDLRRRATMNTREEIVSGFYARMDENGRLLGSRHGQLEYLTTMAYIHRYVNKAAKVLEVGAGTGRYSIALAKEGMDVTALELVESNLEILRENSRGVENLRSYQGDAADLSRFADDTFDATLVLGPMYHLYDSEEVHKAIDEAIRVTKPNGVLLFAFISVYAIMFADYIYGNWAMGQKQNFTAAYKAKHFKEQLFTGYDVTEFEGLFADKPVTWLTTTGTDSMLEPVEKCPGFSIPDEDFEAFAAWYLAISEKRELLGSTNHLLYICRKK